MNFLRQAVEWLIYERRDRSSNKMKYLQQNEDILCSTADYVLIIPLVKISELMPLCVGKIEVLRNHFLWISTSTFRVGSSNNTMGNEVMSNNWKIGVRGEWLLEEEFSFSFHQFLTCSKILSNIVMRHSTEGRKMT